MRVRFQVRFHQRMTYVIQMSSAGRPDTCLSCPISCSTTPGVICMSSACHQHIICRHTCHPHVVHISSACCLHTHVICMPSTYQPHTSLSCPISCSTTPGVICTSSADTHVIHMSSTGVYIIHTLSAGTYVIHTSSAELIMVSVDLNYLSTVRGTGY